jgi:hypothetical protein
MNEMNEMNENVTLKSFKTLNQLNIYLKTNPFNLAHLRTRIYYNLKFYIIYYYLLELVLQKPQGIIATNLINARCLEVLNDLKKLLQKKTLKNYKYLNIIYEFIKIHSLSENKFPSFQQAKFMLDLHLGDLKDNALDMLLPIIEISIDSLYTSKILDERQTESLYRTKNVIRKHIPFTFNLEFIKNLLLFDTSGFVLPLINPPIPYICNYKYGTIEGGYSEYSLNENQNLILNNIFLKTTISQERLDLINKLQDIPMSINSEY